MADMRDFPVQNGSTANTRVQAGLQGYRQVFYLLLSRCFAAELDAEAQDALADLPAMAEEFLELVGVRDGAWLEAASRFSDHQLDLSGSPTSEVLVDLAREYASLFLGVGQDTVPLCESQYQQAQFFSDDNPLFAIKKLYASAGLAKSEDFKEPDDHLAMELAFMAHLCERMPDNATDRSAETLGDLNRQRDFLEVHIFSWAPAMAEKIKSAFPGGFYASISEFLIRFLEFDRKYLSRSMQDVRL